MGLDYSEPAANEVVAGKYRLTRLIGRGGMGSVWEGIHVTLGNRVAVKFIDPTYAESPEARQRFENEARAAARLNSKYAVQVFDHGVMPDGRPFIVMEFLVGEPLDARLDRDGSISPVETAQILSQVCRALSRAHAAGIVHRDLKPENIFLVWDEEDHANVAKVVDFGIAKFTDNQAGISSSTRTGSVLGTPYYMSPEQARGLRSVDFRTDLWSLGVIAYRCIVGRLPFEGESVGDLLVKICTAPIPVPSQVSATAPIGFDAWFARVLQREPSERFATAQELAEQLMLACGLAAARQPLASGQIGFARDGAEFSGAYVAGRMTPRTGVPGVTTPQVANVTDAVFAKTNSKATKRRRIFVASGALSLLLVAGVVVTIASKRASIANQPIAADPTAASGVSAATVPIALSGATVASDSTGAVARAGSTPLASAEVVPVDAAPAAAKASNSAPSVQAPRNQTAAQRPGTKPNSARRPTANHPIDVGY